MPRGYCVKGTVWGTSPIWPISRYVVGLHGVTWLVGRACDPDGPWEGEMMIGVTPRLFMMVEDGVIWLASMA